MNNDTNNKAATEIPCTLKDVSNASAIRKQLDENKYEIPTTLNIPGRARYGLGGWNADTTARKETGGKLEAGPHAYAYQLAVVLTANPSHGSGAESKRGLADGSEIIVALGDVLRIDGVDYTIEPTYNDNIKLVAND